MSAGVSPALQAECPPTQGRGGYLFLACCLLPIPAGRNDDQAATRSSRDRRWV